MGHIMGNKYLYNFLVNLSMLYIIINKITITNLMSKFRTFTQQSRQQILKSLTNQSTSKQAWTFSKQKRFVMPPPNCPYVAYNSNMSTISNRKTSFGSSRRKVFTETTEGPCSWVYKPSDKANTSAISFAAGRSEILANTYIQKDPLKNPGPGRYQSSPVRRRGYSMRPKTANNRNYFIDDKQLKLVPGPGQYEQNPSKLVGKNLVSKFKSALLAGSMHNTSSRFANNNVKTPSVWQYKRQTHLNLIGKAPGNKIGHETRPAFTDKVARNSFTPGPGNYRMPTQFAHYKKMTPYI